jgi:DNA-binding transcriptional LysR family regulator
MSMYCFSVADEEQLNWDDLRYFLGAVRAGTLAGAARASGVDHTTIGRRLASLERTVGAALVLRSPDGLQLTPLGEAVLPLVENVERAVREVEHAVRSRKVRVRLAVPSGFTKYFTGGLARLRAENPDIALELVSGARHVDLKKGEADLAIRSGPIEDAELVVRKLGESGWSLYASDAYLARHAEPVELEHLRGHELIGYDPCLAAVPAAKWIEARGSTAAIVLRSREMTDMAAAASTGVGIAALPCGVGDEEPSLRRLTPTVIAKRSFSLVYRREAKLSNPVRAVIEFVVEVMRQAAPSMSGSRPSGTLERERG